MYSCLVHLASGRIVLCSRQSLDATEGHIVVQVPERISNLLAVRYDESTGRILEKTAEELLRETRDQQTAALLRDQDFELRKKRLARMLEELKGHSVHPVLHEMADLLGLLPKDEDEKKEERHTTPPVATR